MKRFLFFVLTGFFLIFTLAAQEEAAQGAASLDWDIDTVFDDPSGNTEKREEENKQNEKKPEPSSSPAAGLIKKRGFTFDASFRFVGGLVPGWDEAPWHFDENKNYSTNPSVKLKASIGLDARISEALGVKSTVYFEVPNSSSSSNLRFFLDELFFDYSFYDVVFLRAGKFSLNWGISRNYGFANLLSRIPDSGYNRDPFMLKIDIPVGIGGIQLLVLTRANLMGGVTPNADDFAYGGKYNLAHPWFDMDIGLFYQKGMDLRGFLSLKTTLWNTEFYNEWLGDLDVENRNGFSGAVSLGFMREFFNRKFSVNAEIFYNAEKNAIWYSPETDIRSGRDYLFLEGFNLALNMLFRFGGRGNPRLFVQTLYAVNEYSARIIPGFRLSPWSNIDIYFAVPMSLGSKNGYYYSHNEDKDNRPFSFALLVSVTGSVRASHY